MSIRRTQQTVETLWRTIEMRGFDSDVTQRVDTEVGDIRFEYKGKPCIQDPSMNPPKLRGQGCCSRLLLLLLCSMFCSVLLVGLVAFVNLPVVVETKTFLHDHVNSFSHRGAEPVVGQATSVKKQLPAILQRFRMLETSGSLDVAFPEWKSDTNNALRDVAFGISALVEEIEQNPEKRTNSLSNISNSQFEQDTHAHVS